MPKKRLCRWIFCALLSLLFALFAGCGLRPADAPVRITDAADAPLSPTPSPSPTEPGPFTVEFWQGDTLVDRQEIPAGGLPVVPAIRALRIQSWTDENGREQVPDAVPVTENAKYFANIFPVLNENAVFLFADEHGLLRPEDPFTKADAARAVAALVPENPGEICPMPEGEAAAEPLLREKFLELLCALFDREAAQAMMQAIPPYESETLSRVVAANVIAALLGPVERPEGAYYPDASPYAWGHEALLRAAGPGSLNPDALRQQCKDGFLWFDGYLYALDEEGYFRTEDNNGLSFDGNGRFTSGDPVLDGYVAETLVRYIQPDRDRLEDLRAVYYHVKNDFQYLTRNYYASGENGWENAEALTLFETGKGNCYCYAGVFRSLARGLGYNAVCYSGTMGNQNQPHAWTEITMEDGHVYICDPEIEMNYWWVAAMRNDPSMYTDNFMMAIEKSAGWNYQAVGRN